MKKFLPYFLFICMLHINADAKTPEGAGENDPSISITTNVFQSTDKVVVTYKNAPVGTEAWVGIYRKGDKPGKEADGGVVATAWGYTTTPTGTLSFDYGTVKDKIPGGNFYIVMFADAGYNEITPRVEFKMVAPVFVPTVALKIDKQVYTLGETITADYSGGPGNAADWIGIYTPGKKSSSFYIYPKDVPVTDLTKGIVPITNPEKLPEGIYYVCFYENDDYKELSNRIYFIIGKAPLLKTDKDVYNVGENQTFLVKNMPNTISDWDSPLLIVKNSSGVVIERESLDFKSTVPADYSLVFSKKYPVGEYTATLQFPNVTAPLTDIIPFSVRNATGTTAQFKTEIGFCYPNPVTDFVYFPMYEISEVKVYSQVGSLMMVSNKLENRLNLSQLPAGIYHLLVNSNGNEYRFKVVKN